MDIDKQREKVAGLLARKKELNNANNEAHIAYHDVYSDYATESVKLFRLEYPEITKMVDAWKDTYHLKKEIEAYAKEHKIMIPNYLFDD